MTNYSVLMSVYKNEKPHRLKQSMQSIYNQTIHTDDFVLVCDGPLTKQLDEIISEMQKKFGKKLRVIRHKKNHGLGYCLKTGILECKNDLIARMDSDDISRSDRCEKQLSVFAKKPELSVVGSNVGNFKTTPRKIDSTRNVPETHEEIIKFSKMRNPINHPSVMFRKKDVIKVGNYPDVKKCQDWYLWIKMLSAGYRFYNIQETLVYMCEDDGTFERRSGWEYFKTQKNLFNKMRKEGYMSTAQYIAIVPARFLSTMAPNRIRRIIYKKFMRKKIAE